MCPALFMYLSHNGQLNGCYRQTEVMSFVFVFLEVGGALFFFFFIKKILE